MEKLFVFYVCEISVTEEKCYVLEGAAELYLVSEIKRDIPKFDTVLLQFTTTILN